MSQVTIRGIITTVLVTWATPKGILVAREGVGFDKPSDNSTFIQLTISPADTQVASVDGTRLRYLGDVFINIWTDGATGTGEAEQLSDEIATTLFPVVPKSYLPLSVETVPSVKRAILDDSGYRITPITFSYRMES